MKFSRQTKPHLTLFRWAERSYSETITEPHLLGHSLLNMSFKGSVHRRVYADNIYVGSLR